MIRLHILGGIDLRDAQGREVRRVLAQPKRLALLAWLALETHGRFVRRDRLTLLFWPDNDQDSARLSLRQALHFLRRALGPAALRSRGAEEVGIDRDTVWCDAVAFEEAIAGDRAAGALRLYHGELLPSFHLTAASADFDTWLEQRRGALRAKAVRAASSLSLAAGTAGDLASAMDWARTALRYSPDDEAGLRRLVALLEKSGDRAGALRAYDAFARRFEAELGLDPSRETRALIDSIRSPGRAPAPDPHETGVPAGRAPGPTPGTIDKGRGSASATDPTSEAPGPTNRVHPGVFPQGRIDGRGVRSRARRRIPLLILAASIVIAVVAWTVALLSGNRASAAPSVSPDSVGTRSPLARDRYEQGLGAMYSGDTREAYRLFSAALAHDPSFAVAAWRAAEAIRPIDPKAADTLMRRAVHLSEQAPERDRLLIRLAWLAADQPQRAALAESLATRYPDEPAGQLALATLRFWTGDYPGTLAHARELVALGRSGSFAECFECEGYDYLEKAYLFADSLAVAERTAREWIARQPSSAPAWSWLATVLARLERHDEAIVAARSANRLQPGAPDEWIDVRAAMLAGDDAEAMQRIEQRLRYDREDQDALFWRIILLRNDGRLREALTTARLMRGLAPESQVARIAEAQVLLEAGQAKEAAVRFDSLARLDPETQRATRGSRARQRSWSLVHAATAWLAAGDTARLGPIADSISAVAAESAYGRDWRLPHHVRGLLLAARGETDAAIREFRRAVFSPNEGYTRTNFELARSLLAADRPAEAVAALQPAFRGPIDGSNFYVTRTELHELLARAFAAAGRPDSAAAHFRRVADAWARADTTFSHRADLARAGAAGTGATRNR
jgi:DNA-binding SARP family transcriptional activator/Tfp pilus assembly protein PilF